MRNIKLDTKSIRYRCLKCGSVFTAAVISQQSFLKCPKCNFTVLEKVRRDMGNRVLAR